MAIKTERERVEQDYDQKSKIYSLLFYHQILTKFLCMISRTYCADVIHALIISSIKEISNYCPLLI